MLKTRGLWYLKKRAHDIANGIWNYRDKAQRIGMYVWIKKNSSMEHIAHMDKEQMLDLILKLEKKRKDVYGERGRQGSSLLRRIDSGRLCPGCLLGPRMCLCKPSKK